MRNLPRTAQIRGPTLEKSGHAKYALKLRLRQLEDLDAARVHQGAESEPGAVCESDLAPLYTYLRTFGLSANCLARRVRLTRTGLAIDLAQAERFISVEFRPCLVSLGVSHQTPCAISHLYPTPQRVVFGQWRRVATSYAAAVSYLFHDLVNGIYNEFGIVGLNIVGAILRDDLLRVSPSKRKELEDPHRRPPGPQTPTGVLRPGAHLARQGSQLHSASDRSL